jgi:hypothetical protein
MFNTEQTTRKNHTRKKVSNLFKGMKFQIFGKDSNKSNLVLVILTLSILLRRSNNKRRFTPPTHLSCLRNVVPSGKAVQTQTV